MIVRQLCLACALLAPALVLAGCSSGGAGPGSDDYYETILLAGSRVGWAHTDRQTVREDGRILVRTHNVSQLTLVRDGEPVTQKMVLTCWETVDGVLVRFETDQDGSAMSAGGPNGTHAARWAARSPRVAAITARAFSVSGQSRAATAKREKSVACGTQTPARLVASAVLPTPDVCARTCNGITVPSAFVICHPSTTRPGPPRFGFT